MDIIAIVIISILLLIVLVLVILLFRQNKYNSGVDNTSNILIQNQLSTLSSSIDQKLQSINKQIQDQMSSSTNQIQFQSSSSQELIQKINDSNQRLIQGISVKLTEVEETNKQIIGFTKQLQDIQNIFSNSKQRGIIGEYLLENILDNVLPGDIYHMQYTFSTGEIVDAAVFIDDKLVPIDAKFTINSYMKYSEETNSLNKLKHKKEFVSDIKKRIDETSKYVRPHDRTSNIAIMFIPSDAIYNEVINISYDDSLDVNLIDYAYLRKVVIVSPSSLFAYLQTVLMALNTLKISRNIDDIVKYINECGTNLKDFESSMDRMGKTVSALVTNYNKLTTDSVKLSKKLSKVTNNKESILNIEKIDRELV